MLEAFRIARHALEMFRRTLPDGSARRCLDDRLSNRLSKIVSEARTLHTPEEQAEIGR